MSQIYCMERRTWTYYFLEIRKKKYSFDENIFTKFKNIICMLKKIIEAKYGQMKVTRKFKYLGNNGSEKERIKDKMTNLERLSFATGDIYNKEEPIF